MALELKEPSELLDLAKSGDRRSLSRLLTLIESGKAPTIESSDPWTLGITGPPGVGKSTLIGKMLGHWLSNDHKVAILALDPTSPVSGGSFLADRIRMEEGDWGDRVFVRSIASGKSSGGVPNYVGNMCQALSYCGWSRIVIETVGTGQSEVRIIAYVQRLLLVDGPDRGDIIQAEKAGVLELADTIAINKSDLPGSQSAVQSIKLSLGLSEGDERKVHLVSAIDGSGISELVSDIESLRPEILRKEIRIREMLLSSWDSLLLSHPEFEYYLEKLCDGSITADEALESMRSSISFGG